MTPTATDLPGDAPSPTTLSEAPEEPTLLVCDHAEGALASLPDLLESLGFPCDYAVDAHNDPADLPDPALLLVSAELPGGPEGQAYRRLRERYPKPPVVAVAGLRSLASAIAFWRAGAADYLGLPLNPEETVARLQALLRPPTPSVPTPEEPVEVVVEWSSGKLSDVTKSPSPSRPPSAKTAGKGKNKKRRPDRQDRKKSVPVPPRAEAGPTAPPAVTEEEDILARLDRMDDVTSWLKAMPCGLAVLSREGGGLHANEAALSLLGAADAADLAKLLGAEWPQLDPKAPGGRSISSTARPTAQAARDKMPRAQDVHLRRRDGTRLWLRIECAPWRDRNAIGGLVVVLTNVTAAYARPAAHAVANASESDAPPSA